MDDRLTNTSFQPEDSAVEQSLRPHTLREYVGQQPIKDSLGIYIQAALSRHDALDHMLLYGPPGLGKTTLACIVASEMGRRTPHGVRGLKYRQAHHAPYAQWSHPAWGAWIEIYVPRKFLTSRVVAPRMGCVD